MTPEEEKPLKQLRSIKASLDFQRLEYKVPAIGAKCLHQ